MGQGDTGKGGDVLVTAGQTTHNTSAGGDVVVTAGVSTVGTKGGSVLLTSGVGSAKDSGAIGQRPIRLHDWPESPQQEQAPGAAHCLAPEGP